MLFKRRNPLPILRKIRNVLWPEMGWKRTFRYLKHRTVRIPDSSHAIAAGLAIGCAVSWTPTFGTHLIQCAFFCWVLRGNWIAAFLGTAFGNPWTFPFLFWVAYQVGKGVFWAMGYGDYFQELPGPLPLEDMMGHPMRVLLPMLIGGYVCAIISFPLFYYPFLYMIKGARAARRLRIERKAHLVAKEVTGQKK